VCDPRRSAHRAPGMVVVPGPALIRAVAPGRWLSIPERIVARSAIDERCAEVIMRWI